MHASMNIHSKECLIYATNIILQVCFLEEKLNFIQIGVRKSTRCTPPLTYHDSSSKHGFIQSGIVEELQHMFKGSYKTI